MPNKLIWGCDPNLQYESSWIRSFVPVYEGDIPPATCNIVLVESGLPRLNPKTTKDFLALFDTQRIERINRLISSPMCSKFLIHLSDEEGFDGDTFYNILPPNIRIFRNFNHNRFDCYSSITNFPIGPRDIFLDISSEDIVPASKRIYPWSFMGTIWQSGSRFKASSLFLHLMPDGFFHSSNGFARGLPLPQYRDVMQQSAFVLAPEGDRHLDTFRLWECLCCGCIPLVVDFSNQAYRLLGDRSPVPIFSSWKDAANFAIQYRGSPSQLDDLQYRVYNWWSTLRSSLGTVFSL